MSNQKVEKLLREMTPKSLVRTVMYFSQDLEPKMVLDMCRSTFWGLGVPSPPDWTCRGLMPLL